MITVSTSGSYDKTEKWLKDVSNMDIFKTLSRYGEMGVAALSANTPRDSGLTAASWTYEITQDKRYWGITWRNTNVVNGLPIAVLLQYGHGTGTGGYVQGVDYINPAIQPLIDIMVEEGWREVTSK